MIFRFSIIPSPIAIKKPFFRKGGRLFRRKQLLVYPKTEPSSPSILRRTTLTKPAPTRRTRLTKTENGGWKRYTPEAIQQEITDLILNVQQDLHQQELDQIAQEQAQIQHQLDQIAAKPLFEPFPNPWSQPWGVPEPLPDLEYPPPDFDRFLGDHDAETFRDWYEQEEVYNLLTYGDVAPHISRVLTPF